MRNDEVMLIIFGALSLIVLGLFAAALLGAA